MNWRRYTKIGLPIALAFVIVYDISALISGGVDATISRVVLGWSSKVPLLPFGVGVLCGHLFWPQPSPENKP